jgi:hypothetical protein
MFEIGGDMEQVFQALIDRSRAPLDLKTVRTILGHRRRPRYRKRKSKSAEWEVSVERPTYDLTIFKLHCGKLTLKIYTKGERVLRMEAIAHDTQKLDCGRSLEKFPRIVSELKSILERFLDALSCIDQCFIADATLEQLPTPSQVGKTKVGGIDFNQARMRWVAEAVLALAPSPGGFTASELARQVRSISGQSESEYGPRRAAYDLKKLRGKQIVRRINKSQRYEPIPEGLKTMAALMVLRNKSDQAITRGCTAPPATTPSTKSTPLDTHYETIRVAMEGIFQELACISHEHVSIGQLQAGCQCSVLDRAWER